MKFLLLILTTIVWNINAQSQNHFDIKNQHDTVILCKSLVCDTLVLGLDNPEKIKTKINLSLTKDEIRKYNGNNKKGNNYRFLEFKNDELGIILKFKSNRFNSKEQQNNIRLYLSQIYLVENSPYCYPPIAA